MNHHLRTRSGPFVHKGIIETTKRETREMAKVARRMTIFSLAMTIFAMLVAGLVTAGSGAAGRPVSVSSACLSSTAAFCNATF